MCFVEGLQNLNLKRECFAEGSQSLPLLGCLDTKVIEFLSDSLMPLVLFVGCVSCTMYIQLKRFSLQM